MRRPRGFLMAAAMAALALAGHELLIEGRGTSPSATAATQAHSRSGLVPTVHPPVPVDLASLWLAPAAPQARQESLLEAFVRGVRLLDEEDDGAAALPLVSAGGLAETPVALYARYYTGLALLKLERLDEAEAAFASLVALKVDGHLAEDAALRQAEILETRGDMAGALAIYETQASRRLAHPALIGLELGNAAMALGDRTRAIAAFRRVYDDFPMSLEAGEAEDALTSLGAWDEGWQARAAGEQARAADLFTSRRFTQARAAYTRIRKASTGAAERLATIRLAAIDVLTGRGRRARSTLDRHRSAPGDLGLEAAFYYLGATRAAGAGETFVAATRAFVDAHPDSTWAEAALNNLATHYILIDEDERAEAVFNEMLDRYPTGTNAERAAWRAGWWAYRDGRYKDAIRAFEQGSRNAPRSDYRPSWLYWSARAYDALKDTDAAIARYRLTIADYRNTYYGRLAADRLKAKGVAATAVNVKRVDASPDPAALPPTTPRIRMLLGLGLDREAFNELEYARRVWGDTPQLQATTAVVENRLGNLRAGINSMKRAYPQYMAAGGERLPDEILRVLFPVDHWPLLQKYAKAHRLDPYLLAALVAQESTFDADIRSSANAIGLMQIVPATGRRYAARLGIRPFSSARLTNPEVNVRIGTAYFADLVEEFGAAHFALASYNAGENRVRRWREERGPLEQAVFIDDIPFPETQNYVKRILGTAEDYRELYGGTRSAETRRGDAPGSDTRSPAPVD